MAIVIFIILLLVFSYLFNCHYLFYKEKTVKLVPHEEDCFHEDAKSIVKKHGNNDKAVFFIHGFQASPFMYKWAAEELYKAGYDCYAPLIPTHGTDWKEFSDSNYSSWFGYINDYYLALRKEYKTLHVAGISMGGAMTLRLAELYSGTENEMSSICTISAPVVYNSFLRDHVITHPVGYVSRYTAFFFPYYKPYNMTTRPGHNDGDEVHIGYGGIYPKQGVSLGYHLLPLRRDLGKITVPLFACHCTSDKTVPFGNLKIIANETSSKDKKIEKMDMGDEFIHSHHVLLHYNSSRERVMAWMLPFLEEHDER